MSEQLTANDSILSDAERVTAKLLCEIGQSHLFAGWAAPGTDDEKKHSLLTQCAALNQQYPNGLAAYVKNAKKLLADAATGVNPYDGYAPEVPAGTALSTTDAEKRTAFQEAEDEGAREMGASAFVLVAGGLGERLGYNGIKIELPTELVTETSFIAQYCQFLLAYQSRARAAANDDTIVVPLAIMTSGDTNAATVALLAANNNFGMAESQITIVKQELVPSLSDNDAHFVLTAAGDAIECKPHGHGDVHFLLHQAGLPQRWADAGKKWLVFFQDTNAHVFRGLPAAIAVSARHEFVVNSITVPRRPGEAVGAICKLKHAQKGDLTINVEYNQLEALMTTAPPEQADVPDANGFAPYPGNINALIFNVPAYAAVLAATSGAIPEFVNPKYADGSTTKFKKPTRLECMMQEYPKLLAPDAKVGFTQLERWTSFSAVKNNVIDAAVKYKKTKFAESASAGEAALYWGHRNILAMAGVDVDVDGTMVEYCGIPTACGAKVVLTPAFGVTQREIHAHFTSPRNVHVSSTSTLLLDGAGITIESLTLDGALLITACDGANVTVRTGADAVINKAMSFAKLEGGSGDGTGDDSIPERYRIRGYTLADADAAVRHVFDKPGDYVIGAGGKLVA